MIEEELRRQAINLLRVAVGKLGIQQMLILLTVMSEEGITRIGMAERFGYKTGRLSKYHKWLSLSKIIQAGKEITHGLDLIKLVPDPKKYRHLGCRLTDSYRLSAKGLKLLN